MENLLKPFNYKEELNEMFNTLGLINNIEIKLINDEIIINIKNNIITIYYDNCFHLFIKTNNLDSEIITSESNIKQDVLHLINLYNK